MILPSCRFPGALAAAAASGSGAPDPFLALGPWCSGAAIARGWVPEIGGWFWLWLGFVLLFFWVFFGDSLFLLSVFWILLEDVDFFDNRCLIWWFASQAGTASSWTCIPGNVCGGTDSPNCTNMCDIAPAVVLCCTMLYYAIIRESISESMSES